MKTVRTELMACEVDELAERRCVFPKPCFALGASDAEPAVLAKQKDAGMDCIGCCLTFELTGPLRYAAKGPE